MADEASRFQPGSRIRDIVDAGNGRGGDLLWLHGYDVGEGFQDCLSQNQTLSDAGLSGRIRDLPGLLVTLNDSEPEIPQVPDWISEVSPLLATYLGFWSQWVHRWVERFVILDDYRVRVTVSLEITVPEMSQTSPTAGATGTRQTIVPIGYFPRAASLRAFTIQDESGRALPNLTLSEANLLGFSTLLDQLPATERRRTQVRADLWAYLTGSDGIANAAASALAARNVWTPNPLAGAVAEDLRGGVVVYAVADWIPGTRHLLVYSREDRFRQTTGKRLERLIRFIGLKAEEIVLSPGGLGLAQTYHAEITAPDGTAIESAVLRTATAPSRERTIARPVTVAVDAAGIDLVHLRLAGTPGDRAKEIPLPVALAAQPSWKGVPSEVTIGLLLRPDAFRQVFFAGVVISGMTGVGSLLHLGGIHSRSDAATATMVALTAVFAVFLVAVRHRLLNRVAGLYSFLTWGLVASAFVAAAVLAAVVPTEWKVVAWGILACASLLVTVLAFWGLRLVENRINERMAG